MRGGVLNKVVLLLLFLSPSCSTVRTRAFSVPLAGAQCRSQREICWKQDLPAPGRMPAHARTHAPTCHTTHPPWRARTHAHIDAHIDTRTYSLMYATSQMSNGWHARQSAYMGNRTITKALCDAGANANAIDDLGFSVRWLCKHSDKRAVSMHVSMHAAARCLDSHLVHASMHTDV